MKIELDPKVLPPSSSGDIMTDILMLTGESASCEDIQANPLIIEIDGGTADDIQKLKDEGFKVKLVSD